MSYVIAILSFALLVGADQFTKYLAETRLGFGGSGAFIPGFLELRFHINEGAAFGILQGGRWLLVAFTAVVLVAIVIFYIKLPKDRVNAFIRAALTLIAAGAAGNAIDRAKQGYVVDFMNFLFVDFPVFNVADMCIVCGTILMAVLIIFFYKEKPKDEVNG